MCKLEWEELPMGRGVAIDRNNEEKLYCMSGKGTLMVRPLSRSDLTTCVAKLGLVSANSMVCSNTCHLLYH